jgi:cytochrome c-type biogenesis protein CcmH
MKFTLLQLLLLVSLVSFVVAKEAPLIASDPELEKRVQKLSHELRCLVCQNETLADSQADLAEDLRNQIREQMRAGKSDKEVVAYLTDRYGDFVLYRPPVKPTTYLLWFGPFLLLLAGFAFLYRYLQQRREMIPDVSLSADDRKRAEQLLKSGIREDRA